MVESSCSLQGMAPKKKAPDNWIQPFDFQGGKVSGTVQGRKRDDCAVTLSRNDNSIMSLSHTYTPHTFISHRNTPSLLLACRLVLNQTARSILIYREGVAFPNISKAISHFSDEVLDVLCAGCFDAWTPGR